MNREKALEYLLLRNIYACRHRTDIQKCEQLSSTLSVQQIDKRAFSISWKAGGKYFSREVPYDQFLFFASNDRAATQLLKIDAQKNNTAARAIVCELLDIDPSGTIPPTRKRRLPFFSLFGMITLITVLILFGESPRLGLVIFGAFVLAEFLPQGRVWSSALLIGLFLFMPWTAALTAITYGFFQFVDPNSKFRTARILSCITAFTAGMFQAIRSSAFGNLMYLPIIVPAGLLVVLRNTWTIHWRAFPMVLPFVCVGFLLDNKPIDAAVVGTYFLIELLILYGVAFFPLYRFLPHNPQK